MALAMIVLSFTACGGGSDPVPAASTPAPVYLTAQQIVSGLTTAGFNCVANRITELRNSGAISPTTQCAVAQQGGLQVAVPDTGYVFGSVDATGAFVPATGANAGNGPAMIANYNLAPQIANQSNAHADNVSRVVSESDNLTSTALSNLSSGFVNGTGLKPVITGEFSATANTTTGVVAGGNSVNYSAPIGPNYIVSNPAIPVLDAQGNPTGTNGILNSTANKISINSLDSILANGNYNLGDIVFTDNAGVSTIYNQNGTIAVSSNPPVTNLPPVISGILAKTVQKNQTITLGGQCVDPESGVLVLSPTTYTANQPAGNYTVIRSCSDGVNPTVTANQLVTVTALPPPPPVNLPPVLTVNGPISGLIGTTAGTNASCTDPESGVLPVTPATYTFVSSLPQTISLSCTDGVHTVHKNQTATGTCQPPQVPNGVGGCI